MQNHVTLSAKTATCYEVVAFTWGPPFESCSFSVFLGSALSHEISSASTDNDNLELRVLETIYTGAEPGAGDQREAGGG